MTLFEELDYRGLVASTSGNVAELLKTPTVFYVGTDPTADSLHLGHLLAFTTAKLLQKHGHKWSNRFHWRPIVQVRRAQVA